MFFKANIFKHGAYVSHWPLASVFGSRTRTHTYTQGTLRQSRSVERGEHPNPDQSGQIWDVQSGIKPDTVMVIASISWDMTPMYMYFVYIYIY